MDILVRGSLTEVAFKVDRIKQEIKKTKVEGHREKAHSEKDMLKVILR